MWKEEEKKKKEKGGGVKYPGMPVHVKERKSN